MRFTGILGQYPNRQRKRTQNAFRLGFDSLLAHQYTTGMVYSPFYGGYKPSLQGIHVCLFIYVYAKRVPACHY